MIKPYERILHPTDFSIGSVPAFKHALKLALAAKGHISIVHTDKLDEDGGPTWDEFPAVRDTLVQWRLIEAEAPKSAVLDKLGLYVRKAEIGADNPVDALVEFIDRHHCDLIVLGTHAREGLPHWLQGSIAEKLARTSTVATLFLPHGCSGFVNEASGGAAIKDIVVPMDNEPQPALALAGAFSIANALGSHQAKVHLLHIGDINAAPDVHLHGADPARVTRQGRQGDVVEEITRFADELDASMIVMATRGHDGILDALRGSTTERVLHQSGRPLLAVPA